LLYFCVDLADKNFAELKIVTEDFLNFYEYFLLKISFYYSLPARQLVLQYLWGVKISMTTGKRFIFEF